MKDVQIHSRFSFFSVAFGLMVISIGLSWLLQTIGILPADIKILRYACPICVILFGLRILSSRSVHRSKNNQGIMDDGHGAR